MRGIFIPDCTQEEIAEILMYARIGANNSMIGVHKHYISVEDTELLRWIPVSERLPEKEGYYLVFLENGQMVVAHSSGVIANHDFEPKMLAWQPLPEPYKKEGDE